MKKIVLGLAVAAMAISCKKVPQGGNKNVLRMDAGERYDYYNTREGGASSESHGAGATKAAKPQVDIDLNGIALKGFANGMEDQMIKYLKSGAYTSATEDGLKNTWYNFDNVNFKMGSATELEAGSEGQIENLAKILKAYPDAKIKIGGYTDKTGDEAANVKISQGRANFVKSQLAKLGVGAQVVSAEGYGSKFATVDAKASDAERAVDRKMAVRFTK